MVLPTGEIILSDEVEIIDEAELPTYTYRLDFKNGRCTGMTDRLEAMEQAIFKILNTNRFEHLIYSDDYGFESPIGYDEVFIQAELPRRIEESLLQDERITSVDDMKIVTKGDSATITFSVSTVYGDVEMLKEVIEFV